MQYSSSNSREYKKHTRNVDGPNHIISVDWVHETHLRARFAFFLICQCARTYIARISPMNAVVFGIVCVLFKQFTCLLRCAEYWLHILPEVMCCGLRYLSASQLKSLTYMHIVSVLPGMSFAVRLVLVLVLQYRS